MNQYNSKISPICEVSLWVWWVLFEEECVNSVHRDNGFIVRSSIKALLVNKKISLSVLEKQNETD